MNQIRVRLENCYGIRKLEHSFSTEKGQAFLIYAPNGVMHAFELDRADKVVSNWVITGHLSPLEGETWP